MATSAFGNLGMQNLGAENAISGSGLDLGHALLAMAVSKSGLEDKLNEFGLSAKNGKLGFGGPGAVAPTQAAPAPSGLSTNDAIKTLMNTHGEPTSSIQSANQQQPLAFNSSVAPPAPIMGGVVPPTNMDFMSGPGLRERIGKSIGGLFGAA
jgi:hypothetical protein